MTSQTLLVETHELTKVYGNGNEVVALDHVNFSVERGEYLAVMGPSGSGKSTLLNMLGALDRPSSGHVLMDGQDLATVKDLDRFRARTVGFIFQLHNLLPTLSALENVTVPMQGQPGSGREHREWAEHLLELVGLAERADHLPGQLSGGQRQRVAVARALANKPVLILADEPTGSLDTQAGDEVMALLTDLNASQGTTIIVVTHDRHVARSTRRILSMRDGRIVDDHRVADAATEDLRSLARSPLGQSLLNGDTKELASLGLAQDGRLTAEGEALRELLDRAITH
ncbi:MAG: ABC transporter ATP-binding protein [Caldilineae bacterium]|nr:ABC transporter ATP-binding protein [Anaerolineae bacterium]MCB0200393.1 ABC transporter ATP-binding protein [Anaerolineae bacterium]MCB0256165.1 ABC transporter ATP-binding protein [Anaerolineae bacterium]MCB9152582.1 ABC transporter ATP-binding protein [Caldilineae bacterium]